MLSLFDGTHYPLAFPHVLIFYRCIVSEDEVLILGPSAVEVEACTKPEKTVIVTCKVVPSLVQYLAHFNVEQPALVLLTNPQGGDICI